MKKHVLIQLLVLLTVPSAFAQWPMTNDPAFNSEVKTPAFDKGDGPKILLDGAHHNFFIQWDFISPFYELAKADGFQPVIDSLKFTPEYLNDFDIVMIITALPFDFTTRNEVTDETTFTIEEINNLYEWVNDGGSLLVFSEHAPFDQAINPLLQRFGITSSVGVTIDSANYNKTIGSPGWIEFTRENGGLDVDHPVIRGRSNGESVSRLITFGGSALTGINYTNILKLSDTSENIRHATGVGPVGRGNSQGLAGKVGKGKVVALGDSNGFTAMLFDNADGSEQAAGMQLEEYDWKQFVLNTLRWLSGEGQPEGSNF